MSHLIYRLSNRDKVLSGISAYEAWHLQYYLKIYLEYNQKNKNNDFRFSSIIKQSSLEKNIIILLMTKVLSKKTTSITELGSSLLEIIEELMFFNKRLKLNIKTKNFKFIGIENSELFRLLSKKLNFDKNITLYESYKKLRKTDIIYDRAVSSYAFKDEKELVNFYNKAELVLSNLSIFKKTDNKKFSFKSTNQYGNYKIFDIEKIRKYYKYDIYYIKGKKKPFENEIQYKSKKKHKIYRMDAFFIFSKKQMHIKKIKNYLNSFSIDKNFNFKDISKLNKNNFYIKEIN